MSRADRNKNMIASRDQWLATKDGAITAKAGDYRHAYAEGFAAGRKSRTGEITEALAGEVRRLNAAEPDTSQGEITGLLNALRLINEKS